jgi:hypothetical protein
MKNVSKEIFDVMTHSDVNAHMRQITSIDKLVEFYWRRPNNVDQQVRKLLRKQLS